VYKIVFFFCLCFFVGGGTVMAVWREYDGVMYSIVQYFSCRRDVLTINHEYVTVYLYI